MRYSRVWGYTTLVAFSLRRNSIMSIPWYVLGLIWHFFHHLEKIDFSDTPSNSHCTFTIRFGLTHKRHDLDAGKRWYSAQQIFIAGTSKNDDYVRWQTFDPFRVMLDWEVRSLNFRAIVWRFFENTSPSAVVSLGKAQCPTSVCLKEQVSTRNCLHAALKKSSDNNKHFSDVIRFTCKVIKIMLPIATSENRALILEV